MSIQERKNDGKRPSTFNKHLRNAVLLLVGILAAYVLTTVFF